MQPRIFSARSTAPGPAVSTILFDLDGTLVDSYRPITESLNAARAAFGFPPKSIAMVRREVGHGLENLIESNVGVDGRDRGIAIFREHYQRVFIEQTELLPGVAETLVALSRTRNRESTHPLFRMGIVSNKPSSFTTGILSALGIDSYFGSVLGPDLVGRPKPDPAMIDSARSALSSSREETIYVGDMNIDIQTARAAGVRVIVVPSGSQTREELIAARPDHCVSRLPEILEVLADRSQIEG